MIHDMARSSRNVERKAVTLVLLFTVILICTFSQNSNVLGDAYPVLPHTFDPKETLNAAASVPGVRFVHTATSTNTNANYTYIDHPLTNNNPNAIIFVTQNFNPGGIGGTYNNHPIGVWYSSSAQKWSIFNQDITTMPIGAAFDVLIPTASADAFVHSATASNSSLHLTYIDHPLTNNNPNAIIHVTQNYNPDGGAGQYNNHTVGLRYFTTNGKWAIYNMDDAIIPDGADFNVLIPGTSSSVFIHTSTALNSIANYTVIDHPLANNNPNAIILVTLNNTPEEGVIGASNPYPIGVWYYHYAKKWAIFNQDNTTTMPAGASYNVLILNTDWSVFVHIATSDNIISHYTYVDHPLANDNPHAIFIVTQNWNPKGVGGTYNNHAIGVWYSSGAKKWAIFNQDRAIMPEGAAFNVLIPSVDTSVFVHFARAETVTDNFTLIDHPLTNNNPDAIVFATQNWNPSGVGNTYNPYPIGVWYSTNAQKWSVFNQDDTSTLPANAAFNILVASPNGNAFVHAAAPANITYNYTLIDNTFTNNNPGAIVLATQNWNPSGGASQYNNYPIGVWYSPNAQKWSVFNQDETSSMPVGADFNIMVFCKLFLPFISRLN